MSFGRNDLTEQSDYLLSEMSQTSATTSIAAESAQKDMPIMPNGKASAVAPKLSDEGHVELTDISPSGPEMDPDQDIMQLARIGDIQGIEKLYDIGKYDASYCDGEGITPLHVRKQFFSI